ncbi:MAG TPA: nuclease-related domain-containing protein [Methanobacterium sp.]|nr:nuclease-related domain-containing protein [Methanobacterium sp.]
MPYLICEECNIYYEIEDDFDLRELENCGECGKKLKYYETIDEYYNESDQNQIDTEDSYSSPVNESDEHQPNNDAHQLSKTNENSQNKLIDTDDHYSPETNAKYNPKDTTGPYYPQINQTNNYNLIAISGFIILLLGIGVLIFAFMSPFLFLSQNIGTLNSTSSFQSILNGFTQVVMTYILSFVLIISGLFIYLFGKKKNNDVKKSNEKVEKRSHYLHRLPEGYFILNKVRIPLKNINFSHVIIGPTGIFLIKIKKLSGNIVVNENELLTGTGNNKHIAGNPGRKLKTETIELSRFLSSKGFDISHLKISTILAFSNDNFQIEKAPSFFEVLKLEEIDDFIVNSRRKMDETDVIEAMVLLEPYSKEVFKT